MPTENERIVLCIAAQRSPAAIGVDDASSVALQSCLEQGWLERRSGIPGMYFLTAAGREIVNDDASH